MENKQAFLALVIGILSMVIGCGQEEAAAESSEETLETRRSYDATAEKSSKKLRKEEEESDKKDEDSVVHKKSQTLRITGINADDNGYYLQVWSSGAPKVVAWPEAGQTVEVEGICDGKKTSEVHVMAIDSHGRGTAFATADFAALSSDHSGVTVGYEPTQCHGALCQDDFVARLSCEGGEILPL